MMFDHYQGPAGAVIPRIRTAILAAVLVALAGCASTPATPQPSAASIAGTPPVATGGAPASIAPGEGQPWAFATVANPAVVTDAPSLEPGYHCSPCHPSQASQLFGVGAVPGGFLAVGVQQPPAHAVVFRSADGAAWTPLEGWDAAEGTGAIAVAANGGRTVIVGSAGTGAAAWVSEGAGWRPATGGDLHGLAGAVVMNSVVAAGDGWVAGGFHDDPAHLASAAAVWRSSDGVTWTLDGPAGVFAGGRIQGVAARGDTIVAVGSAGDPAYGPAAAWVRSAGRWTRATLDEPGGVMRAVAATGNGFIAVGQDTKDDGARVWRSVDGRSWTVVPDQPSFHLGTSPVRMLSIAADARGIVVGGWRSDAANGSSAAWTSADGSTWQAVAWSGSFSGGQITGVVLDGSRAIGVGRSGYPDNNQAAAWMGVRP